MRHREINVLILMMIITLIENNAKAVIKTRIHNDKSEKNNILIFVSIMTICVNLDHNNDCDSDKIIMMLTIIRLT